MIEQQSPSDQPQSTNQPPNDWLEVSTVGELEQTFFEMQPEGQKQDQLAFDSRYELLVQVGEGAMGQVYLAQDKDLLRKVAYKRLHSQMQVSPEVLTRFVREIQITAQLEHPNVVPVYNLEKTPEGWAYAMKLVFGKTLKEVFEAARQAYQSQLPIPEEYSIAAMLEVFLKVCEAMDFSHQRGVIHRDLKPSNIMIGRYGEVYVMDWGIARVMNSTEPHHQRVELTEPEVGDGEALFEATQMGKILGTPRYLSPEQAAGKNQELDGRSDLLTLGLILQELLTLKPAYPAKTLNELLKKVLTVDRAPLEAFDPRRPIARELKAIIAKASARKPEQRYTRVAEMSADIRRHLRGQAVHAQPDRFWQALLRWMRQHLLLATSLGMLSLLALALLTTAIFWQQKQTLQALFDQEQQLRELQTQSARQARMMNSNLLAMDGKLQRLGASVGVILGHPAADPAKNYGALDFALPGKGPGDLAYVPAYAKLISWDYPVLLTAADMSSYSLSQWQTLTPLRSYLQVLLADAKARPQSAAIAWVNLVLDNGLALSYPGHAGYDLKTDLRSQAWYQQAQKSRLSVWTPPHLDPQGQGLVLTVARPVFDLERRARGVIAFDLRFQYLIDRLMKIELPGLKETYLLNTKGQIMLRSSDRDRMYGMRLGETGKQDSVDTPLFDQAHVVQAISAQKSGYQAYQRNGERLLLAYYPLNALGWYYAVEVSQDRLFEAK